MWLRTTQTSWKAFLLAQLLLVTTRLQISVASCQHVSEVTALFQLLISYLFLFLFLYMSVSACNFRGKGKKGTSDSLGLEFWGWGGVWVGWGLSCLMSVLELKSDSPEDQCSALNH